MECDSQIINGAYKVDADGDIDIVSRGKGVVIQAEAGNSQVNLMAMGSINLTCSEALLAVEYAGPAQAEIKLLAGLLGKVLATAGPPVVGPRIEIEPTKITLSVGPPVVGSSIELALDGITLKFGLTTLKLSAQGIEESIAATTRKLSPLGHEMKAAETQLKVGVEGMTTKAPLSKEEVLAVSQVKATILNVAADGLAKNQAGIEMHGA